MNVLFVCNQNRGRSQMAKALFNKDNEVGRAESAGTKVESEGESLGERAKTSKGAEYVISLLAEDGIDASGFVSRQVTPEMLEIADKAIVMSDLDSIPEWLSSSSKYEYWEILDPQNWGIEDVRGIKAVIAARVKELKAIRP